MKASYGIGDRSLGRAAHSIIQLATSEVLGGQIVHFTPQLGSWLWHLCYTKKFYKKSTREVSELEVTWPDSDTK